jgi:hypothetical protein
VSNQLAAAVTAALHTPAFVDYRRSFQIAAAAEAVLDTLEYRVDTGEADLARPALLRAVTRLRKILEHADDSSGVIGAAGQRAASLYARSCREGHPDRVTLARWLVRFRVESPGWPDVTLADFVAAFDERAMAAYRKDVAAADEQHRHQGSRFEANRMLLELADHDGDVDRAIEVLTRGERPAFGGIVRRLQSAGRLDAAVEWIDRAVAAGRVSGHDPGGNEFWLDPRDVAQTYLGCGRDEDALSVLRAQFSRRPGASSLDQLARVADPLGRGKQERAWAMAEAEQRAGLPGGTGAGLIDIHLARGDLDAATNAARRYGAGRMWRELAKALTESRPLDAARLHEQDLTGRLAQANTRAYPGIASTLVTIRDLYTAAGAQNAFTDYLADLRQTYRRRTSLITALDRRGLIPRPR